MLMLGLIFNILLLRIKLILLVNVIGNRRVYIHHWLQILFRNGRFSCNETCHLLMQDQLKLLNQPLPDYFFVASSSGDLNDDVSPLNCANIESDTSSLTTTCQRKDMETSKYIAIVENIIEFIPGDIF